MAGSGTGTPVTSATPITLVEAKAHLRVDHDDEDTLISSLIQGSTDYAQNFTHRQFVNTTFVMNLDAFPSTNGSSNSNCTVTSSSNKIFSGRWYNNSTRQIVLPFPPSVSITSIVYIDTDGSSQTLATDQYALDVLSEPGRLYNTFGNSWPSTQAIQNAVLVTYVAGYGTAATDTPEGIRQAILLMIGAWYENREEEVSMMQVFQIPVGAKALLGQYAIKSMH